MVRGRKPDAEAVKSAKGNTRRQRKSAAAKPDQAATEPKASASSMPDWLATKTKIENEAGLRARQLTEKIWNFLHPELSRLNFVKSTDDIVLGRFCRYAAEWIGYTEVIDREGAYYTTESPHVKDLRRPHPAFNARKVVEQALRDLGSELGLSPAARQRLLLQLASGLGTTGDRSHQRDQQPGELPMAAPAQAKSPIGMLSPGSLVQ